MGKVNRREYWVIFGALTILTILEVLVTMVPGISKGLLTVALVSMAVAKAGLVMLFYMHLKHETKPLRMIVMIPFALPALYALVLIFEAGWRYLLA